MSTPRRPAPSLPPTAIGIGARATQPNPVRLTSRRRKRSSTGRRAKGRRCRQTEPIDQPSLRRDHRDGLVKPQRRPANPHIIMISVAAATPKARAMLISARHNYRVGWSPVCKRSTRVPPRSDRTHRPVILRVPLAAGCWRCKRCRRASGERDSGLRDACWTGRRRWLNGSPGRQRRRIPRRC